MDWTVENFIWTLIYGFGFGFGVFASVVFIALRDVFGRGRNVDVEAQEIRYDCIEFDPAEGGAVTFRLKGAIVKTLQVESESKFVIYYPRATTLQPKDCCKRCSDKVEQMISAQAGS